MSIGGFAAGLLSGVTVGRNWREMYEQGQLKKALAEAAGKAPTITEQASGEEAQKNLEANFVPQEGGPQTAAEYLQQNPAIAEAIQTQKAGFNVGDKTFDSRSGAESAAQRAKMDGIANAYEQAGMPEQGARMRLTGMQLKNAERQDKREDRADSEQAAQDAYMQRWRGIFDAAKADPVGTLKKYLPQYNDATDGPFGDGHTIKIEGDYGVKYDKNGKKVGSLPLTPQNIQGALVDAMRLEGSMLSAGKFDDYLKHYDRVRERSDDKEFQREGWDRQDTREEKRLALDRQRLGMEGARLGITQSTAAEEKAAKKQAAEAGVALYKENNPNATPAQLEAVRTGIMKAIPEVDKSAPAEVKLANAYVQAGLAKNQADGLRMATQSKADSPEKIRAEIYGKALQSMGTPDAAKKATDSAMSYLFPQAGAPAAAASQLPPVDQREVGKAYDTPKGKAVWRGNGWELVK